MTTDQKRSPLDHLIRYCLENKLIVIILLVGGMMWGVMSAPFDWNVAGLPRDPVPVDAIPDIGENQQIVFTPWMGRSPQDVEDQITYPLTVALLGVPGVKTVRSYSMLGFSSIYVIFDEDIEFYWSRSRILEKLNSLPSGTLPSGVAPALGPDATALGQVFWYTLEGRDDDGNPTGGWDLHELRTIQDWNVRYALSSVEGVSEVASVGGFVQEYQIDVDPDAMRAYGVRLDEIINAVRMSNADVGARTIEINQIEYVIRGLGFIESIEDLEVTVIKSNDHVPVTLSQVAHVSLGPALRRGALDKEGAEAVGGVVVVRYGENPLAAIQNLKKRIAEIQPGLPRKTLDDGTVSQVTIVPFYDRSQLIHETLGTLNRALEEEILVTVIVVIIMVLHLRSSLLIAGMLPVTVLFCFVGMRRFGVDANIVALSGIAIAIGTIVDMGIVICENILKHLDEADPEESRLEVVYRASTEVGSAVLTAVATTIVGFLPVFAMEGAEGKLFKPLAYTKTFALISSIVIALTIVPAVAQVLFTIRINKLWPRRIVNALIAAAGVWVGLQYHLAGGAVIVIIGSFGIVREWLPEKIGTWLVRGANVAAAIVVLVVLAQYWEPLGPEQGLSRNFIFAGILIGSMLAFAYVFQILYPPILAWCLRNKLLTMTAPIAILMMGLTVWHGFDRVWSWLPETVRTNERMVKVAHAFPGLGKQFMPALDEGAFLYMPSAMPHASIGESLDQLHLMDQAIYAIPEVNTVVGKIGRAETPLDPAPIGMVETIIGYKSEYITNEQGRRLTFRFDEASNEFVRDENGELLADEDGRPFRQWRDHIRSPNDIWDEIVKAAQLPGMSSAPKLQPIEARIVMLQSGMRAPMGIKVKGPDLETIEKVALDLERLLKEVTAIQSSAVLADRPVGKPYLEIDIDRERIARFGIHIRQVQNVIESAIGGRIITQTVEGRERYPVRVRYLRELRDDIESLGGILVPAPGGAQIPLRELATFNYVRGPQVIKSEDTMLIGYVFFDKVNEFAEVEVIEQAQAYLTEQERVFNEAYGDALARAQILGFELTPAEINALPGLNRRGCQYNFAGTYENQIRAEKRLMVVVPLALAIIFLILYFQFKSATTTFIVFSGILVAWGGGFVFIWLYGQNWFMNFDMFDTNLRDLFQMKQLTLSVAIWVGFLALFGVASDNGVIVATYLKQAFTERRPETIEAVRDATVFAGTRRVRPCLMTTVTTILALLPVLTSTGRGADIMVPMAIPTFGGMLFVLFTMFSVPTLYASVEEFRVRTKIEGMLLSAICLGSAFTVPLFYGTAADLVTKYRAVRRSLE